MEFDYGIDGYEPRWLRGWRVVRAEHGERLRGLVGRVLTRGWLTVDPETDRWFTQCPVLLDFEGEQVEINHKAAFDVSITWNTVDPTRPVVSRNLRWIWRDDIASELVLLRGQTVRAVDLLEWFVHDDIEDDEVRDIAVALTIGNTELVIYDEADDTRLRTGPPTPWHRRHHIG
ncbi:MULTISPECIES: hypothetical protein [Saccharothrix]|uniref:hypothetical protein n=1 Tax=Saccharothrix TaxID=2071 RepID=UPI00093B0510|nr:hypothetical protein [Saccharothrix sp. CB00851]OKI16210.1 hypothetical protein A6A25_13070 [Saccharothrix sp. CB00851]